MRRPAVPTLLSAALLLVIVPAAYSQEVGSGVIINEIMFDPRGEDAGREWVELWNEGKESASLSGWLITNRSAAPAVKLPDWKLPAGAFLVVYLGHNEVVGPFGVGSVFGRPGAPIAVSRPA